MPRRCPQGVICFENVTFFIIVVVCFLLLFYVFIQYNNALKKFNLTKYVTNINEQIIPPANNLLNMMPRPTFSFTNTENDILMNPYAPPLKDTRLIPTNDIRGGVPINISTQAVDTTYRQLGLLKNGGRVLPLMGRPLFTNRDKFQYYTMNDSNNQIKLPISYQGKSCTNEYGCNELMNGDNVYVEGLDGVFSVTMYDNATMRYLPFV